MTILIFLVTSFMLITKFLDAISTLRRIHLASDETNPIASNLMVKFGIKKTVYFFTGLALVLILTSSLLALSSEQLLQLIYIAAGLAISIIQGAVAHGNWFRRDNVITRPIRRINLKVKQLLNYNHFHMKD